MRLFDKILNERMEMLDRALGQSIVEQVSPPQKNQNGVADPNNPAGANNQTNQQGVRPVAPVPDNSKPMPNASNYGSGNVNPNSPENQNVDTNAAVSTGNAVPPLNGSPNQQPVLNPGANPNAATPNPDDPNAQVPDPNDPASLQLNQQKEDVLRKQADILKQQQEIAAKQQKMRQQAAAQGQV